ncbi:MAG: Gfo/Idh/MocA family oxidoreductase [Balneolaceae bacterium]|nr:Gfo/Idh/MocA family oxidoreductase [Balneolaceae bacterium]
MDNTSFSVCGYGRIGKRHAHIIHNHDKSNLGGIIDPRREAEQEVADSGLDVPVYQSLEEFIRADQNNTDVINICTPNGLHASLAVMALKAGYHVVIEKPMALTRKDCERVIEAAEKTARFVFVVKQNRYSPTSTWLKEIVEEGVLGKINLVQISCFWNRDERYYSPDDWHGTLDLDGGVLYTQFSHFVDILYWVFGDIDNISALFSNETRSDLIDFEDTGSVIFELDRGGMGSLNYTIGCWEKNMESSITVIGSKGSVKIGGQYMNTIEYCNVEDYNQPELPETNPPNDYGPYQGSAANHHFVIENVINTLSGSASVSTTGIDGMKVVDIIERIYKHRKV